MTYFFEYSGYFIFFIFLVILTANSLLVVYRRPFFSLLTYRAGIFLFIILGLLFVILTLYSIATGFVIAEIFGEIITGIVGSAVIFPGAWRNALRACVPRLIWLRRIYPRYRNLSIKEFLVVSISTGFIALMLSSVIFTLIPVEISPEFNEYLDETGLDKPGGELAQVILVISASITEEIFFRFALMSFIIVLLKPWRYAGIVIAVLISSVSWTLMHTGITVPLGVKEAQIMVIGVIFGWLFLKYGVEASIIAHAVLNLNASLGFLINE